MEQAVALLLCSISCLATQTMGTECSSGEVRLVGGDQYEGIVEYCSAPRVVDPPIWRPVCGTDQWTDFEAGLACNSTGLPGIVNAIAQSCVPPREYSSNDSALNFKCNKTETSLETCRNAALYPCNSALATCIVEDACADMDCPNNSMCNEEFDPSNCSLSQQLCLCDEGWTGKTCETEHREHEDTSSAPCDSSFCLNGGTCLHPDHNCTCPENWTGKRCEQSLQDSSNIVVIAVSVVAVLLALLVVISLLITMGVASGRRRKSKRKSRKGACDEMEMNTGPATRNTTENSTNEVTPDTATHEVSSLPTGNSNESNSIMPIERNRENTEAAALGPRYPQGMYDIIKLEDSPDVWTTNENETRKQIVFVNSNSEPKSEGLDTATSSLQMTTTESETEHGYSHLNRDYRRTRFPRGQKEGTQPLDIQCTSNKQYQEASYDKVYSPRRKLCATYAPAQYDEVGPPAIHNPPMAEYDEVSPPAIQNPSMAEYDEVSPPAIHNTMNPPMAEVSPPAIQNPPMAEYDEVYLPINEYDKTYSQNIPMLVEPCSMVEPYSMDEYGKLSSEGKLPTVKPSMLEHESYLPPMVDLSSPLMQYDEQNNLPVAEYDEPHSPNKEHCGEPSLPNQSTAEYDKPHSPSEAEYNKFDHNSDHSHGQQLMAMYEEPHLLAKYDAKLHKDNTSTLNSEDAKTQHDRFEFSAAILETENPVTEQQNVISTGDHSITSIDGREYSILEEGNTHKVEEGKYSILNWEMAAVEELAPEVGLGDRPSQKLEADVLDPASAAGGPPTQNHLLESEGISLQRTESSGSSQSQAVCTQQGDSSPENKGEADIKTTIRNVSIHGNEHGTSPEVQNQLAYSHMRHL